MEACPGCAGLSGPHAPRIEGLLAPVAACPNTPNAGPRNDQAPAIEAMAIRSTYPLRGNPHVHHPLAERYNGTFTNPADWRGGIVPGASDNAILDAAGSAFTVTSGVSETVRSVRLSSNATLSLTAGTFDAVKGTGSGANAGVILVGAGATLVCGGTVTNAAGGVIQAGDGAMMRLEPGAHLRGGTLASAGSGTFVAKSAYVGEAGGHLVVDARLKLMGACTLDGDIENDGVILQAAGSGQLALGAVTLTGGGVFDMALYGGFEGDQDTTLVLAGGTIRGAASVSVGALTIGAAGLMVNDTAHDLVLSAGPSMVNDGTIEASGAGLVLIDSPLVNEVRSAFRPA